MSSRIIFLLTTFIFSASFAYAEDLGPKVNALVEQARHQKLAEQEQWLKLGHYTSHLLGAMDSQVDGPSFFLSPQGKENAAEELEASLRAIFEPASKYPADAEKDLEKLPDIMVLHPACRFPARVMWFRSQLGQAFNELEAARGPVNCYGFLDFERRLSAESVTLVFSSFFVGGPSSTFGHTLLRVNSSKSRSKDGVHHELLDHGINFAAVVTTQNPIFYALFGLIGVFKGTFSNLPYYYKVREYSEYEARDLWGYDIKLTPEELKMLVAHLWELGSTYYDYFYFTENCSYHMFTTLEAAAPRLKLVERLPFYVIPSDTARAIYSAPGVVSKVTYRPSIQTLFYARVAALTPDEQKLLEGLVLDRNLETLPSSLDPAQRAKILDAALDYMEFRYPEDILKDKGPNAHYKQKLLVLRAGLGVKSEEFVVPEPERGRPHVSHGIRRWNNRVGHEDSRGTYIQEGIRWALHDPLDPQEGYPSLAQVEFMNWVGRYELDKHNFELDELTVFRVLALDPFTRFKKDVSYRVEFGAKKVTDRNCSPEHPRCIAGGFEVAMGGSLTFMDQDRVAFYAMPEIKGDYSPAFARSSLRFGAGPRGGAIFKLGQTSMLEASGVYRYELFSLYPHAFETHFGFRQSFGRTVALDFSATRVAQNAKNWDLSSALMVYF